MFNLLKPYPSPFGPVLSIALLAGVALPAHAQWTVTSLHPVGQLHSLAFGGSGAQQAGFAFDGLSPFRIHAGYWNQTAASWVDLHPAAGVGVPPNGDFDSVAYASSGATQVGQAHDTRYFLRACLWNGTPESWVNLDPGPFSPFGTLQSQARGASGDQQAGSVDLFLDQFQTFALPRASLWTGTAASWENLHPGDTNAINELSVAYGTDGTHQVGWFSDGSAKHAGMWSGSAASWVDLHPQNLFINGLFVRDSEANAVEGGQQVGHVTLVIHDEDFPELHACLWTGAAASWLDLHPTGAYSSEALSTSGFEQVGVSMFDDRVNHASLWSGSSASWEDLSLALTGQWGKTEAHAVWRVAGTLYVAGWGENLLTGQTEALLWSKPIGNPCLPDTNGDGVLSPADFSAWVAAFNTQSPACDQNGDSMCTPADFSAWVANFNAGC